MRRNKRPIIRGPGTRGGIRRVRYPGAGRRADENRGRPRRVGWNPGVRFSKRDEAAWGSARAAAKQPGRCGRRTGARRGLPRMVHVDSLRETRDQLRPLVPFTAPQGPSVPPRPDQATRAGCFVMVAVGRKQRPGSDQRWVSSGDNPQPHSQSISAFPLSDIVRSPFWRETSANGKARHRQPAAISSVGAERNDIAKISKAMAAMRSCR